MSLTLGDAHTKSCRWVTPHRQNLYSDEDHLRPATSLVLPDQKEKFEDFIFVRLVLQQFLPACCPLLPEGHRNKIRAKRYVRPGGFTGRLRACPFLGRKPALLCGEGIVRALDEAAPFIGRRMTRESLYRRGTDESFTPYV